MLIQIKDSQITTEYNLESFMKDRVTFGRGSDNDIILHDINVSRNHGYFSKNENGWIVYDNNSTNGIVINDNIIQSATLHAGDNIVLSVKNQDKAVKMFVTEEIPETVSDRVGNARSTNRYIRMTSEQTEILAKNNVMNNDDSLNEQSNPSYINDNKISRDMVHPKNEINKSNTNKSKKLLLFITGFVLLFAIVICMLFIPKLSKSKKNKENSNSQITNSITITTDETTAETTSEITATTATTTEEIIEFNEINQIEYMTVAELCKDFDFFDYTVTPEQIESLYQPELVYGFEAYDIDNDNSDELLIDTAKADIKESGELSCQYHISYVIDSNDNTYSISLHPDTTGLPRLKIDDKNHIGYLCRFDNINQETREYFSWSDDGWVLNKHFSIFLEQVYTCVWDGEELSPDDWLKREKELKLRDLKNNTKSMSTIETEAKPVTVADSLMKYCDKHGYESYKSNSDDTGTYYIVIDNYTTNLFENRLNKAVAPEDALLFEMLNNHNGKDIVFIVKARDNGSSISCKFFDYNYDIDNVQYDNGLVLEIGKDKLLFSVDNEKNPKLIRNLNITEAEQALLENKWYMIFGVISGEMSEDIVEYEFYEDGTCNYQVYKYINEKWVIDYQQKCYYYYNAENNILEIVHDLNNSFTYYYEYNNNPKSFITYISDESYSIMPEDYNLSIMYASCMVPYDTLPDACELCELSSSILYDYFDIDPDNNVNFYYNPEDNTIRIEDNTAGITKEQALRAVTAYCYEQNPSLNDISQDDYYWEITDSNDYEHIITYKSYTGAFVYYHVNISSGDVTTTEYVPGVTDEEVIGTESFNVWDYL